VSSIVFSSSSPENDKHPDNGAMNINETIMASGNLFKTLMM
jgi:hypothetical protein